MENRPLKIVWVKSGPLHPPDTGGKIRTFNMLKVLRHRHNVHYIAFREPDGVAQSRADEYSQAQTWVPRKEKPRGSLPFYAAVAQNAIRRGLPFVLENYVSSDMERAVGEVVRQQRPDLIVCDFLTPATNVLPQAKALGAKTLLFEHNVEALIWERMAANASGLRRLHLWDQWRRMERWERRLASQFDGVVAVSEEDAALLRDRLRLRNVLGSVPTGVDTIYFSTAPRKPSRRSLLFLGSMDWMPNIDGVLWFAREVLPKVREQMPDVRVKIIGRNPPASIRALAADLAIEVTGTVPEVQPHVHECRVIAVPLLAGGGTRIKIFEAMAMGVPVISTTIGAEGLPVRHGEEIEIADDAESFAKGTLKLLADAAAASRMAANARELMEQRFSWRFAASKFVELCQQAMDHQQRPS